MDEKQFICYLVKKFPELKDFLSLINGWSFYSELMKILRENKWIKKEDDDIEELKIINNQKFSTILFYMKSATKEKRVQAFSYLLNNMLEWIYSWKMNEYADNKNIIDKAYNDYMSNFNIKIDNVEMFDRLIESNKQIRFTNFQFLKDCSCNQLKQCIALWWRYWVWKTVFAINLIKDVIESNENVTILYFWTSEVNKEAFLKRFMTMISPYPIQQIFNDIEDLKDLKLEIENIIKILNFDIKSSLANVYQKLRYSKYFQIKKDIDDIKNRIKDIEEEIIRKKQETSNDVIVKSFVERKTSEIRSLELKIKEREKTLVNYLNNDVYYLNITEKLFNSVQEKIIEINKDESNVELIDIDKSYFEQLNVILWKINRKNADINVNQIVDLMEKINKFLKYLNAHLELIDKNTVKDDLSNIYTEQLKSIEKDLDEKKWILYSEYQNTIWFLSKENVSIEDRLNINSIEQKLQIEQQKFPDRKILFIIDYHQKVDWFSTDEWYKKSFLLWEKVVDLCNKYNAYWIVMSQLKNMFDSKSKASSWIKWLWYRPDQADLRDWEWLAINIWSLWIIFNRDTFPLQDWENIDEIDRNFVIYEIYLTKNRYWANWMLQTRQYFIFDKKKITYLPVSKKWYKLLDEHKEVFYLTQLFNLIKESQPVENITLQDIIE